MPTSNKVLARITLLLSVIGFIDATYLTVKYYQGGSLACSVLQGCDVVTSSKYASLGPIPVSLIGLIYYLALFFLIFNYLDTASNQILKVIFSLISAGLAVTLYLVYLQIFVIQALCLYCLVSAGTTLLLWLTSLILFKKNISISK